MVQNAKANKFTKTKNKYFKLHFLEWKDVFLFLLEKYVDKDFYVELTSKYDIYDVTFFQFIIKKKYVFIGKKINYFFPMKF